MSVINFFHPRVYCCSLHTFQGIQLNVAQSDSSSSRDAAVNTSLPLKAAAPAAAAASKEVSSAPSSKAFDISAVPVVIVSGPLLRSCSKAVSTIVGDPDMMWFVTPGECAFVCMRDRCLS